MTQLTPDQRRNGNAYSDEHTDRMREQVEAEVRRIRRGQYITWAASVQVRQWFDSIGWPADLTLAQVRAAVQR
jgi:hypothetical protein